MGMKKDRAVQGEGGVHLSLIPELGNEWKRALRGGVHLEKQSISLVAHDTNKE